MVSGINHSSPYNLYNNNTSGLSTLAENYTHQGSIPSTAADIYARAQTVVQNNDK